MLPSPPCQFCEPVWPSWGAHHLRNADGLEAALAERDGDIAAAAALVVIAPDVAAGRAAALAVGVIGPGAAAPVAVGVLGAGAVAALAVPLVLVRAGEAGAVPLGGEEELAAQTGAQARTAPLPRAAGGADTHSRIHGSYSMVTALRYRSPAVCSPGMGSSSPWWLQEVGCDEDFSGHVPTRKLLGWHLHISA